MVVVVVLALAGGRDDRGGHRSAARAGDGSATHHGSVPHRDTDTGGAGSSAATTTAPAPSTSKATEAAASSEPVPPRLPTAASNRPHTPAERKLERALGKWLKVAGPSSGALVYDLSEGRELYSLHPGYGRPPASVEKLWTTTALLNLLGPDARLDTTVLGSGHRSHHVWHGNLYLHGGGDPTYGDATFNHVWNRGYGPTPAELIAQLKHLGIRRVTGRVYGDESLFDHRRGGLITDYKADTPDFGGQLSALTYDHGTVMPRYDPATFAAHQFVATMRMLGMQAVAGRHDGTAPEHAQILATAPSPPMSVMLGLMNVPSDDLFAELLTKQLGLRYGHGGTLASGARVIAATIAARYGLHPTIYDGSGLGRQDRSSPKQIVQLETELWHTRIGNELQATLPTVGVNGTVQSFGIKTPAARHCVAKTGSLNGVSNLAGYCSARGHHQIAFAILIDGPENATGFWLESKMVGAIARY